MTITTLGTNFGSVANGGSLTLTVPVGGIPAGSLIYVYVSINAVVSITSSTITATDSAGANTFLQPGASSNQSSAFPATDLSFYAYNSVALAAGQTIKVNNIALGTRNLRISGLFRNDVYTAGDPFDSAITGTGTNTTMTIGPSAAPANSNSIFIGAVTWKTGATSTFGQASGWVSPPDLNTGGTAGSQGGSKISSSAETYAPTATGGATPVYLGNIVIFRPAPASAALVGGGRSSIRSPIVFSGRVAATSRAKTTLRSPWTPAAKAALHAADGVKVRGQAQAAGRASISGRSKTTAWAKPTAHGTTALVARSKATVASLASLRIGAVLASRAAARLRASGIMLGRASFGGSAKAAASGRASASGRVSLSARAIASVSASATIGAVVSLVALLGGVFTSIRSAGRANGAARFAGRIRSRISASSRLSAIVRLTSRLRGKGSISAEPAADAALAIRTLTLIRTAPEPAGTTALNATATGAVRVRPRFTPKALLSGSSRAAAAASMSMTRAAALVGTARATLRSTAVSSGVVGLSASSTVRAFARAASKVRTAIEPTFAYVLKAPLVLYVAIVEALSYISVAPRSSYVAIVPESGGGVPVLDPLPDVLPHQEQTLGIDFGWFLPDGMTLLAPATVTLTVASGEDPNPQSRITAGPFISTIPPALNGTGKTDTAIIFQVLALPNVEYVVDVYATRLDGDVAEAVTRFSCIAAS